jgi:hypothetical protein
MNKSGTNVVETIRLKNFHCSCETDQFHIEMVKRRVSGGPSMEETLTKAWECKHYDLLLDSAVRFSHQTEELEIALKALDEKFSAVLHQIRKHFLLTDHALFDAFLAQVGIDISYFETPERVPHLRLVE